MLTLLGCWPLICRHAFHLKQAASGAWRSRGTTWCSAWTAISRCLILLRCRPEPLCCPSHTGSEWCVAIARDDMMFRLDDLARSFGYFGSDGRDHGINVRHRWGLTCFTSAFCQSA